MNQQSSRSALKMTAEEKQFFTQARTIVRDLFNPNPLIFWLDFIVSALVAYTSASFFLAQPLTEPLAWVAFFVSSIFLYRASLFVHEVVHMRSDKLRGFKLFWNIFAGIPMFVPSFAYESHLHHHSSRHYGTEQDGEYLPLASGSWWGVLAFLAQIFFQPILVFLRFLIGTPISFLHPSLRSWIHTHASSLVINFKYEKEARKVTPTHTSTIIEVICSFRAWVLIGLIVMGLMPEVRLPKILMLAMCTLTMNHIRTLAAHRYTSDGEQMSHLGQFYDSTNITGNWMTELLYPLGLRYHALHHLFPGIPYHNLGIAHRRLVKELPPDSLYHQSIYRNTWEAISELLGKVMVEKNLEGPTQGFTKGSFP